MNMDKIEKYERKIEQKLGKNEHVKEEMHKIIYRILGIYEIEI